MWKPTQSIFVKTQIVGFEISLDLRVPFPVDLYPPARDFTDDVGKVFDQGKHVEQIPPREYPSMVVLELYDRDALLF